MNGYITFIAYYSYHELAKCCQPFTLKGEFEHQNEVLLGIFSDMFI